MRSFGFRSIARLLMLSGLAIPLAALPLHAEVRLPHSLSDHAVLQRRAPIHLWGWADPKEPVTVEFHGQTKKAVANDLGEWSLWLLPEQAGGPYTLTVRGAGAPIVLNDLLVGDVWFASGQSNMQFPLLGFPGNAVMKDSEKEIAAATHPQIRLLRVEDKASNYPVNDITTSWTECTPVTAKDFSAVAYFFGREIQEKEHVPIGLIDSSWGGTPVEPWISLDALTADASLMPALATWSKFADEQTALTAVRDAEKREDDAADAAHQPKPKHPWHPMPESWQPGALYNGMIAPLTPYTIKGVIWYQGETNSKPDRAPLYNKLFSTMIENWREEWKQGQFPFLYVQISSFNSPPENWGVLRDQQRRTLAVANTAMAVSIDVGQADNVHPPDKQTVGARLALAGLALGYGHAVEYSGPLFREATPDGASMRVYFDHAADGLHAKGGALAGFELAGKDKIFYPATATVDDGKQAVVVTSAQVTDPMYVRYAWQNVSTGNLYNAADLPASTFTSE